MISSSTEKHKPNKKITFVPSTSIRESKIDLFGIAATEQPSKVTAIYFKVKVLAPMTAYKKLVGFGAMWSRRRGVAETGAQLGRTWR